MTVDVNFHPKTGFSYIEIRDPAGQKIKLEYQGEYEKPTGKYSVDPTGVQKREEKKVLKQLGKQDAYGTAERYGQAFDAKVRHLLKKEEKKVDKRIDAVYGSLWGGVEIDGLDESAMLRHWRETDRSSAAFFKGSAFGWPSKADRTSHAVVARLLAIGLPAGMKKQVSIGVKTRWTAHDVQVYAETIWAKMR